MEVQTNAGADEYSTIMNKPVNRVDACAPKAIYLVSVIFMTFTSCFPLSPVAVTRQK